MVDSVDFSEIQKKIIKKRTPFQLKVDWFAFTVPEENDIDFKILTDLGYNLSDFEVIPGQNFYNSGFDLGGYVKIFFNDYSREVRKGSSHTHNYVFTGVGCSNLQGHIKSWVDCMKMLRYRGVKFRRIDLALDDFNFEQDITFEYCEKKLSRKHFRSSKKKYNILKDKHTNGSPIGETIYYGSLGTSGKDGRVILRQYAKGLQMMGKHQESALPQAVLLQKLRPDFDYYHWTRWELEITKAKAETAINEILRLADSGYKKPISRVYYGLLRDTIDFLVPTKNSKTGEILKNKSFWKTSPKWEKFLKGFDSIQLENPKSIYDLGSVHSWLLYFVMPTIQMLDEIYKKKGLSFYRVMESLGQCEYSKKQKSLIRDCDQISKAELMDYAHHFLTDRSDVN